MSERLKGVVVSHGRLGAALVEAAQSITGDADALIAVTNEGCGRDALFERVQQAVGDEPCVVFVDLPGGSCFQAAARLHRDTAAMAVVAGVNLAMLLDFVHHADDDLAAAAERAVQTGGQAIQTLGR
jgi:mannose/fructose-specific phosphotransferase system component IIA